MFPKINPTKTESWKKLQDHLLTCSSLSISDRFSLDEIRFKEFSISFEDFLFDYSKNNISSETLSLLCQLAEECQLSDAIDLMFSGENINETENRAVLHTALRNFSDKKIFVDGQDVVPFIDMERQRIKELCSEIHTHKWLGCTGKPIKYVVNIGIGGSDLGASMVTEALRPYWKSNIKPYYISNVDASNLQEVIQEIDFEETLFIIASKTFTTQETMTNARSVRQMFLDELKDESFIQKHFVAITGNTEEANTFGISSNNVFQVWDWVCGRFSLWGSMGLSIALTVGYDHFESLLKGANSIDLHFQEEKSEKNIPVIMGLLSVWNINFLNTKSEAILAYDHYLSKFKSYLQQSIMESNGKNIDRNGQAIDYQTGQVIWGETGTNGQHSFYQLIHQGTEVIPCDFIMTAKSQHNMKSHQNQLLSNALAQTEALMRGKTKNEVLKDIGEDQKDIANFKVFSGNKPTNSILIKELTPYNLGSLIAIYEHKTFVQGVIWNIFSFDQWGVELGKELSSDKLASLKEEKLNEGFDSSTNGLISQILKWNNI